jgi:hypothetical protein
VKPTRINKLFLVFEEHWSAKTETGKIEKYVSEIARQEISKAELELLEKWGFVHINSYPKSKRNILPMTWQIIREIKAEDKVLLKKLSEVSE